MNEVIKNKGCHLKIKSWHLIRIKSNERKILYNMVLTWVNISQKKILKLVNLFQITNVVYSMILLVIVE